MKETKTARTRAHIIASTAPVFNKKGYAGTSITDLTQATGLTSGSIYGNFSGKEEVALAALDYNIHCFSNALQLVVSKGENTKERLLAYVKAFHSSAKTPFPEGGCPMQNALCDADDTLEPLRKRAAEGLMEWKKAIAALIQKGLAEGVFKPHTDAEKTALHLIALCEFAISMYSATKSHKRSDEIVEMAMELAKGIIITT